MIVSMVVLIVIFLLGMVAALIVLVCCAKTRHQRKLHQTPTVHLYDDVASKPSATDLNENLAQSPLAAPLYEDLVPYSQGQLKLQENIAYGQVG